MLNTNYGQKYHFAIQLFYFTYQESELLYHNKKNPEITSYECMRR